MKKKLRKKEGEQKGITLISLIVTIIVLIILAGVTIAMLTGENGLLAKAQKAKEEYEKARIEEEQNLNELEKQLSDYDKNLPENLPENTPENPQEAGTEVALKDGWGTETVKYIKTSDGEEATEVEKVATVYAVSVGGGETVPVPKGFYYVGGTKKSGVVISDDERDKNKFAGQADVPSGAVYNNNGTIKTENLSSEEQGQILYGNQFVWIPSTAENYKKTNFGLYNASWESNTAKGEITYIKKYGGFYIGRYEAGTSNLVVSEHSFSTGYSTGWTTDYFKSSNITSGKITCKAGEIPYYHADYTTAKTMAEAMYDNNYVQSGLVTGTMWDVTLNYFKTQDSTLDLTNSAWGNYNDTTLTNCKGRYLAVDSGSTSNATLNSDGSRHYGVMTCGSTEEVKKCNIYDMAGNLWEWTEEIAYDLSNNYYMLRGRWL